MEKTITIKGQQYLIVKTFIRLDGLLVHTMHRPKGLTTHLVLATAEGKAISSVSVCHGRSAYGGER